MNDYPKKDTTYNYGNGIINAVSGDFDSNSKDEYATLSHGPGDTILISLPIIDSMMIDSFAYTIVEMGPMSEENNYLNGNILARAGDVNMDDKDELILAWINENDSVIIQIFTLNENHEFLNVSSLKDEALFDTDQADFFGIELSDRDNNGDMEIITAIYSEIPDTAVYVKVFSVSNDMTMTITERDRFPLPTGFLDDFAEYDFPYLCDITVGDYDGDSIQEITVGLTMSGEPGYLALYPLEIDSSHKLSLNEDNIKIHDLNWNGQFLDLVSGDANGDGRDEILAGASNVYIFYTAKDDTLGFEAKYFTYIWGNSLNYVAFENVDNDPGNGEEIILSQNVSFDLRMYIYKWNENWEGPNMIARYYFNTWDQNLHSWALVTGDFDGDIFRIGPGKKYTKTDIVQPLVILNAPPTHFDMFGQDIFDVNYCHDGQSCLSYATYATTTSQDISVSATLNKSWGVSATASAGGSYLGVSASAYLTTEYGKNFSKTSSSSETVTVSQQVTATYDDQIYATVCDYEMWEYTIYNKNDQPSGNIITLSPTLTENRWFPSKERSANGYVPKHEVGNILSYTPYKDLINPDGEDKIRGSYGGESYDLDANTDVTYNVNLANTFNSTTVEGREIGVEVGGSVGGWGIEVSGAARYDQSQLSTHSMSVGEALDITVHLAGINRSIGETGYNVTPYIYWSKNGAMVIDYAARPILPEPGGTDTWWSAEYDIADPTFILPWKLDPEKGLALQDEVKRTQSKSISFSPAEPKQGDTITVTAYVHNFSPYPTANVIPVSFYVGDPMENGTLIQDLNGETVFYTENLIDEQSNQKVSFQWKIPNGLESYPRIYAFIDPANELTEVHEDNNIGWVILGKSEENSVGIGSVTSNENFSSIYPNPAKNELTLIYELKKSSDVRIEIYDYKGQVIKMFEEYKFGNGIFELKIDLQDINPGMYIYKISTDDYVNSGKFIRMK